MIRISDGSDKQQATSQKEATIERWRRAKREEKNSQHARRKVLHTWWEQHHKLKLGFKK